MFNQANLILRFLLELAALAGFAFAAWHASSGFWRIVAAIAVVLILATLWATFAVPGDPSRSGNTPVPTPGWIRLILELTILLGGAYAFYWAGQNWVGVVLAGLVILHYALSMPRIGWLLQQ